jgi:hypothetical protein
VLQQCELKSLFVRIVTTITSDHIVSTITLDTVVEFISLISLLMFTREEHLWNFSIATPYLSNLVSVFNLHTLYTV